MSSRATQERRKPSQLLNLTNRMKHICPSWSFLSSDIEIMLMLIVESQKDAVQEKFIRVWEGAE